MKKIFLTMMILAFSLVSVFAEEGEASNWKKAGNASLQFTLV